MSGYETYLKEPARYDNLRQLLKIRNKKEEVMAKSAPKGGDSLGDRIKEYRRRIQN